MSEQRGFTFSLAFIVIFSVLLATIPVGLRGPGESGELVTPIDPNLISDFSDSVDYDRADFVSLRYYYNALGGRDWFCLTNDPGFYVFAKILVGGILWLGGVESCTFKCQNGTTRGEYLSITEIQADADDGTVRYSLEFTVSGNDAGGFVAYWNTTAYATAALAWPANGLHLMHGVGVGSTATANIVSLIVGLLFLQLPNVPLLVNVLIAVPIWATIVYLLWFIIKETIPFV